MKYITYKQLLSIIPRRAVCLISHAASVPTNLLKFLVKNNNKFEHLEIIHMNPKNEIFYTDAKYKDNFRHNTFFVSKFTQQAIQEKRADFIPINFSETPKYIRNTKINVYFCLVSRRIKDKVSLGISVDYEIAGLESTDIVIAIQNDQVPYTFGAGEIGIKKIDFIIKDNRFSLSQYLQLNPEEKDKISIIDNIANNIIELIEDGSILQAGVGSVPDKVLEKLMSKNDLGIHSEMMSDGFMKLIKNGNVTNKTKKIHKGLSIVTFALGTKNLYRFLDRNKKILFKTVDYVNDPHIIAKNNKMISINSAVEVDLHGQVNGEVINDTQISGVGGQVDFVRGARMSKGGKSIIAFPSTISNGKISRIITKLGKKGIVTTTRNDVDYIGTEYGCVKLSGKTLNERKNLLISIAHPKFRDALRHNEL